MKQLFFALATAAGLLLAVNNADARFRSVVKVRTVGVAPVTVGFNHAYGFGSSFGFGTGFGYHANSAFLLPRASYGTVGLGMGYGYGGSAFSLGAGCGCPAPTPAPIPTPAPVPPPQPLPPPTVQADPTSVCPAPAVAAPVMGYAAPVALAQSYGSTVRRVAVVNTYAPTVAVRRVHVNTVAVANPYVGVNTVAVAAPRVVKQKTVTRTGFRRVRTRTVTRVR